MLALGVALSFTTHKKAGLAQEEPTALKIEKEMAVMALRNVVLEPWRWQNRNGCI